MASVALRTCVHVIAFDIMRAAIGVCLTVVGLVGCDASKEKGAAAQASPATTAVVEAQPSAVVPTTSSLELSAADWEKQQIERYGSCEVTFEGGQTRRFVTSGGQSALGSDYFMNDDEIRKALSMFGKEPAKLETRMKADPRLYIFVANCSGGGLNLNFGAGANSKYSDIPFGPGKYRIGNEKGAVSMMGSIDSYKTMFRAAPGGRFEIQSFDGKGMKATFEFQAIGDFTGTVKGKLDYRCAHDTSVCRAAR